MNERRPGPDWTEVSSALQSVPRSPSTRAISAWLRAGVFVVSELCEADLPDGTGPGLQWLISISRRASRPRPQDVRRALRAFGMKGAEEDNHEPGIARKFWLPVDPAHRVDCECKATDELVVEPDGYRWSNARDPALCRGCDHAAAFGRPCPVHSR